MQLFNCMDGSYGARVLSMRSQWWSSKAIPCDACLARSVPISKKGDIDQPPNYRIISLLNSSYKLCMGLFRDSLQVVLDPTVSALNMLRPCRSTSHAIFLAHRVQDTAERRGTDLVVTFMGEGI